MDEERKFSVEEFGRRARRRRRLYDLKQQEVADQIDMSRAQYAQLERGVYRSMQLEQLAMLATVLRTTTDYLLQRTDEEGEIPPLRCPAEGSMPAKPAPLPVTTLLREEYGYA